MSLFHYLAQCYALIVLLRILLQLCQVDYNQFVQLVVRVVDPVRNPFAVIIPAWGRLDLPGMASVVVWLSVWTGIVQVYGLGMSVDILACLTWGGAATLVLALELIFVVLLAGVVLSWVSLSGSDVSGAGPARTISQLSYALCEPVRRVVPPLGGLDFSPLVMMLLVSIAQGWVRPYLMMHPLPVLGG